MCGVCVWGGVNVGIAFGADVVCTRLRMYAYDARLMGLHLTLRATIRCSQACKLHAHTHAVYCIVAVQAEQEKQAVVKKAAENAQIALAAEKARLEEQRQRELEALNSQLKQVCAHVHLLFGGNRCAIYYTRYLALLLYL